MDWFERITGFAESDYAQTQGRLSVVDGRLFADGQDRGYAVGRLELPSLAELRVRVQAIPRSGCLRLSLVEGDVRAMHRWPENQGAVIQVASQANLLEMIGPDTTPEHGVTRYEYDRTQGPACAMAAGAGTIVRNYLAPVGDGIGQTAERQLDTFADLGRAFADRLGVSASALWRMRNGYVLPTEEGLAAIGGELETADEVGRDGLRGLLRIGVHQDVEVTDGPQPGPLVTQAFCSALPVAYGEGETEAWAPFGRLVLEAAYEATLLAGVLNAARGASTRVLLTRLGGGAFGNVDDWIDAALLRACQLHMDTDLDVVIVSYRRPTPRTAALVERFNVQLPAERGYEG